MAGYTFGTVLLYSANSGKEIHQEAGTIRTVRIIVYLLAFAAVIGIAVAIAWLSIVVAPLQPKQGGLTLLAVALGGLGVAGGVVYLAEKLIYLAKGAAFMLAEIIVEKFKKREREIGEEIGLEIGLEKGRAVGLEEGREIGREEGREEGRDDERQAWQAWHRRQQAALRAGLPFDEPTPGSDSENSNHPGESS